MRAERVEWVDSLKFIGMFYIYLGHLGNAAGQLFPFVFSFHVPLFFFVSGFFAEHGSEKSIVEFACARFRQIMIPYYIYSVLSIPVYWLSVPANSDPRVVLDLLQKMLLGVRNDTPYAPALWFLPCIFVTSVFFRIAHAFTADRLKVGLVFALAYLSSFLLPETPPVYKPLLWLNVDSAMYYGIFYCLGWLLFGRIRKFDLRLAYGNPQGVAIFAVTAAITFIVFLKGMNYPFQLLGVDWPAGVRLTLTLPFVLAIFVFHFFIANLVCGIGMVSALGRETLLLCGLETVTRSLIVTCITLLGLSLNLYNAFSAVVFTGITLSASYHLMVPLKNRIAARYRQGGEARPAEVSAQP
jgi:fucose 4-O-acetylase-like acetyltransferase